MRAATQATRDMAGLTILALAVRLWWVLTSAWTAGDTDDYLKIARNLAFHHAFSLSGEGAPLTPTVARPPLYPFLISLFWWNEGPPALTVMVLQALLGAATVVLVYLTARDYFSRAVALIACLAMVFAPMTGYFTAVLLTETLFTFLLMLAVFLWGRERAWLAGLAFGLAALTRSNILLFLLALPLVSLLPALRQRWRTHLTVALVALALPAVWTVRNAAVSGEFVPISASGWGANLLCGTLETELIGIKVWTGSEWALLDLNTHPVLKVDKSLSEMERDSVRLRRALRRIADAPARWLLVRAQQYPKLFLDSGNYVLGSDNLPVRQALSESRYGVLLVKGAFVLGNLLAIAIAAFGLYVARKRLLTLFHLIAFPAFLLLVQLPTWTESRYSLPIMPVVAIFFAVGSLRLLRGKEVEGDEPRASHETPNTS